MKLDDTQGRASVMSIRFHGVRGSYPVPGPDDLHFGGNTSCVEVASDAFRIVFDCGTGAIALGNRLAAEAGAAGGGVRAVFLMTHLHHDHTMGWPFFKPLYDSRSRLSVYGPGHDGRAFRELFESAFAHPYFPVAAQAMPAVRTFDTLAHGDVITWADPAAEPVRGEGSDASAFVVRVFRNRNHPNGGVLNYRIERKSRSVVIATDVEGTEGEQGDLVDFARGADLLIHDAQYTDEEYERSTQGWGHSTWRMAADVAQRSGAQRLVLYHHDPAHDDAAVENIERRTREKFPRTIAACEGLEISI